MSIDDQLVIFNKMSFARVLKPKFLVLRSQVLDDYNQTINQDAITITDLKADYHISNGMLEKHLDSIEKLDEQLEIYQDLFEKEINKPHPDIDTMVKISLVIERYINRLSVLNTGTPIILFVKFQSKKQKLEVQQMKEKFQQQMLLIKKELEDRKRILEEKTAALDKKDNNVSNKDIEEKDNVTNPNIDELEHYAKLKDSGNRTIRSNINRSNSKQNTQDERVQSDASNSSTTGTTSEDRVSEIFGGTEERRSKEAVF